MRSDFFVFTCFCIINRILQVVELNIVKGGGEVLIYIFVKINL